MEIDRGSVREMTIRPRKSNLQVWLGGLALGALLLIAGLAPAGDSNPLGLGTNVRFPDYYDYPNQSKLRTLVQGSSVTPLGTNRYLVKDVHIESFSRTGERESIVDAPDCTYDHRTRVASSEGPIKAQSGDGQMKIEGTGFMLTMTNKSLFISNNVRTVIRDPGITLKKL